MQRLSVDLRKHIKSVIVVLFTLMMKKADTFVILLVELEEQVGAKCLRNFQADASAAIVKFTMRKVNTIDTSIFGGNYFKIYGAGVMVAYLSPKQLVEVQILGSVP